MNGVVGRMTTKLAGTGGQGWPLQPASQWGEWAGSMRFSNGVLGLKVADLAGLEA